MNKKNIGQKILNFPLTRIIIGIIVVVGIYVVSQLFLSELLKLSSMTKELNNLVVGAVSAILAILSYVLLYRFYEKRKITELSTVRIGKYLTAGVLLGIILQSLTILIIYLKGGFTIVSINSILFIIPSLTMAFSSAIFEEILFRGIIFRIIEEKLGSYLALIISALIFGTLHLANPNSSLIVALGLAIQAGLLLASAYIYARNLWFPIAIHFAWNFTQSGIFGAIVSGNTLNKSLLTTKIQGADWFTGGQFGPEGSIQATIFCLIATIVLLILCYKQKKIIKPYWKEG
ncbi:MAG: CPBP family intramembrane metalloprotease [Calditrichaeota bacterium]|nr:CPBP family intramembrane metalloprotease [Calditrichota bacterium]